MTRKRANSLLVLVAFIWGSAFVAQAYGMKSVGPALFTGLRFMLGGLLIIPLVIGELLLFRQRREARLNHYDYAIWFGLGLLMFAAALCQQIGIQSTTVTNAGLITACYVPFVSLISFLLFREIPHISLWPMLVTTCYGYYLLGGRFQQFSQGDVWVFVSCIFWAAHVVGVGRAALRRNLPMLVAFMQFMVCGLLSLLTAYYYEAISMASIQAAMLPILYGGVLSVGVGFTLQVVAQRHCRPLDAALLLSTEFIFAALAGALLLGERLSMSQYFGAVVVVVSIIVLQYLSCKTPDARVIIDSKNSHK